MTISEKVAYLKGLSEGLNIDTEKSKEGKLISVIVGILEEVGLSIEDLEESVESLGEELDAVSDDLSDVEDYLLDEDEEEDEEDEEADEEEDDDYFEVKCPNCDETLVVDEDVLKEGTIQCPNCKEKFTLDLSDGCDCGCEGCSGKDEE